MNKENKEDEREIDLKVLNLLDKKYEIFYSQIRLSVMLILYSYQKIKISELQKVFNISSGKLEHHLNSLEKNGLIKKTVGIFLRRFLTTVEITEKGENMLLEYLERMRETLKKL